MSVLLTNYQMGISSQKFLYMTQLKYLDISDDVAKPSLNEAVDSITVLKNYILFSKFGADLMKSLKDINRAVDIVITVNTISNH